MAPGKDTMRKDKLKHLITVLERAKALSLDRFTMNYWFRETECSFSACAAGWACQDFQFKQQGLHICEDTQYGGWDVAYEDLVSFEALESFFEISEDEAGFIFDPVTYDTESCYEEHPEVGYPFTAPLHLFVEGEVKITPQHVIDRIKWILEQDEK